MSRIFYVEATIYRLYLDKRIIDDADGDTNFTVKIDLIDIPSLTIPRNESLKNIRLCDDNCGQNLDYYGGRACYFIAKSQEVVNLMKRKPLKIGIYRMNERFPLCHGIVPFSGCVCDLVSKAMEEPSPFEFSGNFNLIDPGGNFVGHASLGIIILDLGKVEYHDSAFFLCSRPLRHVIASFALVPDSFVLKNDPHGAEYACGLLKNVENNDRENYEPSMMDNCWAIEYDRENLMRDIVGVSLAASTLSRGKPEVKKVCQVADDGRQENNRSKVKPDNVDEGKLAKKKL